MFRPQPDKHRPMSFDWRRSWPALPVLAITLLMATTMSRPGQANSCPVTHHPEISVQTAPFEPEIRHDLPRDEVQRISVRNGASPPPLPFVLSGLAVNEIISWQRVVVHGPHPQTRCFRPDSVEVRISASSTVYIVNELSAGQCRYQATLQHEMRHVEVLRDGLQHMEIAIRNALNDDELALQVESLDSNDAASRYQKIVQSRIDSARAAAQQEMARRNGLLDTPAAYRADSRRCP